MSKELANSYLKATGSLAMGPPYQMIAPLLKIPMRGKKDPRIAPRRRALKEVFELLLIHDAVPLEAMLASRTRPKQRENRQLVELFRGRLAEETREQMIKILRTTIQEHKARKAKTAMSRKDFERNLALAARYLSGVGGFGRSENHSQKALSKDWEVVPDFAPGGVHGPIKGQFDAMMELKENRDPSVALKAIVGNQKQWSMDCSQWVQAVTMNAMIDTMGGRAFDREMASRGRFHFRVQNSTANWRAVGWQRNRKKDPFQRLTSTNSGILEERGVGDLLRISPAGTRIALSTDFRDILKERKSVWTNENAVKIKALEYAAFGFRIKTPMSLKKLADAYALSVAKVLKKDITLVRRTIFVQSIEQFRLP